MPKARTAKQKAASKRNIKKAQAARRKKGKSKGTGKKKRKNNPGTLKAALKEYGGPAAREAALVVGRKLIQRSPRVAAAVMAGKSLRAALGK